METSHPQLLAREAATESARVLNPQLRVIEELTDYGTHLIMRVLSLRDERRLQDFVVVGVLCKQVVTMLDGVAVLLRSGCAIAAGVPARSLWEADLQMTWIAKEHTTDRSRAFWISHLLQQIRRCASELPGSEHRKSVGEAHGWRPESEVRQEVAQLDLALSQPGLAPMRAGQEKARFWAAPLGAKNRRVMADQLGRLSEYDVLYSLLSGSAHGESPNWHVRAKGDEIHLRFIRDPREATLLVRLVAIWTLRCYSTILSAYRPEELTNFGRRYQERWRSAIGPASGWGFPQTK